MNIPAVHLNFVLPSFEDPFSSAMDHNAIYDGLHILVDEKHGIDFTCELPDDAYIGDIISLSATNSVQRNAQYFVEYTLQQQDIEAGDVKLRFYQVTCKDDYVLQLVLHGKHETLKDSIEFNATIEDFGISYLCKDQKKQQVRSSLSHSIKQYMGSLSSFILSLF